MSQPRDFTHVIIKACAAHVRSHTLAINEGYPTSPSGRIDRCFKPMNTGTQNIEALGEQIAKELEALLDPEYARVYGPADIERATGTTCMGVGDGSGKLFVYGDYESIKAAQAIVLRLAEAEQWNARLTTELDAVSSAIGGPEYMDPPDGGNVSLGEQVRRMKSGLMEALRRIRHAGNNFTDWAIWAQKTAAWGMAPSLWPEPPEHAPEDSTERDAERYRWLRDHSKYGDPFYMSIPFESPRDSFSPNEVDAAIDAMLEARKP